MAKNKLIKCKACDADIAASAKTCPHCGAKNKKPFYKKAWVWILVVLLLIGMTDGDEETENSVETLATEVTAQTEALVETTEAIETTVPVETATPVETTIETTVATEATTVPTEDKSVVSAETVAALIEANVASNFTNYDISYDETGITLSVWEDGVSAGAVFAAAGSSEYVDLWNTLVESMEGMCQSMVDFAVSCGRNDLLISLNVLNDQNTDNILLMLMDGVVVYDAVNDG